MLFQIFFWIPILFSTILNVNAHHAHHQHLCSHSQPDYTLQWQYDPQSERVIFIIEANVTDGNFLTGFAISPQSDKAAELLDFLGVLGRNGHLDIADGHVTADNSIAIDKNINAESMGLNFADNVVNAALTRPLNTSDPYDVDLSNCFSLYVPADGSVFDPDGIVDKKLGPVKNVTVCDMIHSCPVLVTSDNDIHKRTVHSAVCEFAGDGFITKWWFDSAKNSVVFDIEQNKVPGNRYSAIGFGNSMEDLDVVIAFFEDGEFKSLGDFYSRRYEAPKKDGQQNYELRQQSTSGHSERGTMKAHIQFSRPINTNDEQDKSLDDCIVFNFLINGGEYDNNESVHKHEFHPKHLTVCDIRINCLSPDEKNVQFQHDPMESTGGDQKDEIVEVHANTTVIPTTSVVVTHSVSGEPQPKAVSTIPVSKPQPGTSMTAEFRTGTTSSALPSSTTGLLSTSKQKPSGCPRGHQDMQICKKYFEEYLQRVAKWAQRHHQKLEAQYWKACTLLVKVAYLTTVCCNIFEETCAPYMK